ncbi:MAG: PAS domain S-box protein [Syntrophales bacterium]|nr:PAS domain S-box protein [Syntrophales bacterium]
MNEQTKTNPELIEEISALTQRIRGLEQSLSERKQAMVALRENEVRCCTILMSIEDGYFEVDLAGNFTFFNDSVCRMLGYSQAELLGMNSRQYTDEENGQKLYQVFNKIFRTGEPARGFDHEIIRKDGTRLYIESSASLIRNIYSHPVGFRGIMRNITGRRRAEEALRKSKERFQAIFKQTAVGVAETEMVTGRFLTVNRRLCELVGRSEEELLATTFQAITHPDDLHLHEEKTALLLAGKIEHYTLEKRYVSKDGAIIWVNLKVSPIRKPGDEPARNIVVVEDITERKRIEDEIWEMSFADRLTEHSSSG